MSESARGIHDWQRSPSGDVLASLTLAISTLKEGTPDDYYAERILSQLDIYDKLLGLPAREKPINDDLELRRQTRQIQHEADIRNGWV